MGWRQAHSDLIWIQGCTSDRQRSNVERAEGLIRKKCFFLFLTKHLLTASVSLTYMSQKNVFPNLEKLFEKKTLCSSYDSAGRRLEVIVQIRSARIIRQSSLSEWGSFWLPRLWHWPRWVMLFPLQINFLNPNTIQGGPTQRGPSNVASSSREGSLQIQTKIARGRNLVFWHQLQKVAGARAIWLNIADIMTRKCKIFPKVAFGTPSAPRTVPKQFEFKWWDFLTSPS